MPPKTASVDRPVCRPRTSASARIWATSSRVGATTSARGPRGPAAGFLQQPREDRDQEGGGLARPGLGLARDVAAGEGDRQGLRLDRRREDETRVGDAPADLVRQGVLREEVSGQVMFGGRRGHEADRDTISARGPVVRVLEHAAPEVRDQTACPWPRARASPMARFSRGARRPRRRGGVPPDRAARRLTAQVHHGGSGQIRLAPALELSRAGSSLVRVRSNAVVRIVTASGPTSIRSSANARAARPTSARGAGQDHERPRERSAGAAGDRRSLRG